MIEVLKQIKKEKPEMSEVKCLLILNEQSLKSGNLKNEQTQLRQDFLDHGYTTILLIIRSNYGKEFAFYIPCEFDECPHGKVAKKQLAFYWINES